MGSFQWLMGANIWILDETPHVGIYKVYETVKPIILGKFSYCQKLMLPYPSMSQYPREISQEKDCKTQCSNIK